MKGDKTNETPEHRGHHPKLQPGSNLPGGRQRRPEGGRAAVHIDPHRNDLTPEEVLHTTAGNTPAEANGWGLLDTGTGSLDKVEVRNGKLANMDCGQMHALCIIGGKVYQVIGDTLTD